MIDNIYGVFIDARHFVFLAVLEMEFFKILTWCKHRSLVSVPRKQFLYQESNRPCTVYVVI